MLLCKSMKFMIICYTVPEIWHGCNFHFSFSAIFCPFTPPKSPKNQNLKKGKKNPGDIIILHMCTKNYDHMMYVMVHNGQTNRWTKKVT